LQHEKIISVKLEIGFIGLGVMGGSMAGHILKAGHSLSIYNRTASKCEALANDGAVVVKSPKEVAERSEFIFICAGDGASVRELIFGSVDDGSQSLSKGLRPGAIVVDHSTISPDEAIGIATDLEKYNVRFLDAPVTGGDIGARSGTLTIMVGGDENALEIVRPILDLYSKKIALIGKNGFGQKMKAVNQIGAIGGVAVVTEMLKFAQSQGLEIAQTIETLKDGAAGSFALNLYGPKIINGDFKPGFSVKHSKKDAGIVLSQAQLELPIMNIVYTSLENAAQKGLSEEGNHVMFNLIKEKK
jgi:3-hydroxyisobutyrate dehydrogenase